MVKTYGTLFLEARKALLPTEGEMAANMARELLCAASGKSANAVIADRDLYASEETCQKMEELIPRAAKGEPLAYLLGEWDFFGMQLHVTPDVLIPRDDTMAVTELALEASWKLGSNPRILDLCTGSGCIGLALAHKIPNARVTLADISQNALKVAKMNIQRQNMRSRVMAVCVDALQPAGKFLRDYDLIISNPPYITGEEMKTLQPSVRDFEPHLALYGGEDGLDFYRAIIQNFKPALREGGYLCFEFGMGQHTAVGELLEANGYRNITFKKDTSDIIRAVIAQKKEVENNGIEETGI